MYNDIKLMKGMYKLERKSFTSALEELDPSSNYVHTPLEYLDAYERQLYRYNIRINDDNCSSVDAFFKSEETAVLFPEFIRRCIMSGFEKGHIEDITAVKTMITEDCYPKHTVDNHCTDTDYVSLIKFPTAFNMDYESVKNQSLMAVRIILESIGVKLAASVRKNAISVLMANTKKITISSSDFDEIYEHFDAFDITTVITAFNRPKIKHSDDTEFITSTAVPSGMCIALDRNFALEFIMKSDFGLDVDQIMNKENLEEITVSIECGFKKIVPDAVVVAVMK